MVNPFRPTYYFSLAVTKLSSVNQLLLYLHWQLATLPYHRGFLNTETTAKPGSTSTMQRFHAGDQDFNRNHDHKNPDGLGSEQRGGTNETGQATCAVKRLVCCH